MLDYARVTCLGYVTRHPQLPIGGAQQNLLHRGLSQPSCKANELKYINYRHVTVTFAKTMYSMELLSCLRTTEPLFRTYDPSDYRTLVTESCKSRHRTYEPSDCRTFGMKNPLFRTHEPSDYGTFGLESSHRLAYVAMHTAG